MHSSIRITAVGIGLAACSSSGPAGITAKPAAPPAGAPALSQKASPESHAAEVKRTLLVHEDIANLPGMESRLYLVEYPPGVEAPVHVHTEQCIGYVLEGRFESAFGDALVTVVRSGEGFVDLAHQPHHFKNPDPSLPLRFVIAGTFHKDELLFHPVTGAEGSKPAATATAPEAAGAPMQSAPPREGSLTEVKRSLLAQSEIADLPGMESRIYLMEFPPLASSKLHVHSAQGVGYVLEGSFESAFGDGPTETKRAGEAFVDLPNKPHRFRNADASKQLRFIVAGTYHHGEPLFQAVDK